MARALSNIVYLESPEKGVDGRGILSGARDPLMTDGRLGDFWINTVSKHLFGPKNAGEWPDKGLIRGAQGWAPVLVAEADGTRRVFKISDWTGGEGAKPATGYLAADGTVVPDIEDAADFRGVEGPEMLVSGLTDAAAAITDETLMPTAQVASDNEKRAAVEVFDLGGTLDRRTVAHAQASNIRKQIGTIRTQAFSNSAKLGGAHYKRVNGQPTHGLCFRSLDRWTAEGAHDSANGGWWEIDEIHVDVTMAGSDATGIHDSTTAIDVAATAAQALGVPLTFPPGSYRTAGGHRYNGLTVYGAGRMVTEIVCTSSAPSSYIFRLGDISTLTDIMLRYDESVDVSAAASGQFVGLYCGNEGHPLCKGARVSGLSFRHVGTAFHDHEEPTFSVDFANLEFRDFTYAIIDFLSDNRTQNSFKSLHIGGGPISGGRNNAVYVINFEGINDTGMSLDDVNIESTKSNSAFRFVNCIAVNIGAFHVEDWCPSSENLDLFVYDASSFVIGRASVYYSILKDDCSIFGAYSARRHENTGNDQFTNNGLSIGILSVTGLYSDENRTTKLTANTGMKVFKRRSSEAGEGAIYVTLGQYSWYSYNFDDENWYRELQTEGDFRFLQKGNILPYGDASARPVARQSDYVSRFYDTEIGIDLLWDPIAGWIPPQGATCRSQTFSSSGTIENNVAVVIVSAAGGNVTLTLPKTPGPRLSRMITIVRVDGTGNVVTVVASPGDVISPINVPLGVKRLLSDGFNGWLEY